MLSLNNVHTYYGESHILQGVSLVVKPGEAIALLGRNGVGKTTTISSIIGFERPRHGQILHNGEDIVGKKPHQIAQRGIGLVPQGRGIFPTLTVRENLTMAARSPSTSPSFRGGLRGGNAWTFDQMMTFFPNLKGRLKNYGHQLSGGEQQMLAIARALMTNPQLLLLDEPSEGLAPLIVAEIGRIITQIKESGLSILLVEQNLAMAFSVADRAYVMSKGQIAYEGRPDALRANRALMDRLLGVGTRMA